MVHLARALGLTLAMTFSLAWRVGVAGAQQPNHPIITEVYTDAVGANDGPVGRDPTNLHQEFLEIYVPPCSELDPALDCSALNLTFYEVEGDHSSSGLGLVNYRFDLPPICLLANPAACAADTIARPSSGVIVLGWVDYVGDPPTGLAGSPDSRIGLVNGGITSAEDYVFIAINGHHFNGTTNFPVLLAESLIDLPSEAGSGVIQNGSGAYLLVNRDSPGYVELCDDQHAADCAAGAAPVLPNDMVGLVSTALFDGLAGNDDIDFKIDDQPLPECNDDPQDCVDLQTVLPEDGAFSLLVPQMPEVWTEGLNPGQANGYARIFVDVPNSTETPGTPDPVDDAFNSYRHVRNNGPFSSEPVDGFSTRAVAVIVWIGSSTAGSPPELLVAVNVTSADTSASCAAVAPPVIHTPGKASTCPPTSVAAVPGAKSAAIGSFEFASVTAMSMPKLPPTLAASRPAERVVSTFHVTALARSLGSFGHCAFAWFVVRDSRAVSLSNRDSLPIPLSDSRVPPLSCFLAPAPFCPPRPAAVSRDPPNPESEIRIPHFLKS